MEPSSIVEFSVLILFSLLFIKLLSFLYYWLFPGPPIVHLSQNINEFGIPRLIRPFKRVVAIDTEMVGAGVRGSINLLARVSLVDEDGCFYDKFVKPTLPVTDYRTPYSGIKREHLTNAEQYYNVQSEVAIIIKDCILVGHDLEKDLNILHLTHPDEDIRDTANCTVFRMLSARHYIQRLKSNRLMSFMMSMSNYDPFEVALRQVRDSEEAIYKQKMREKPSLKNLARIILDREIQVSRHSSVEDAQTAYDLYQFWVTKKASLA